MSMHSRGLGAGDPKATLFAQRCNARLRILKKGNMRILMAQSCSLVDGCLTRTQHRAFAWGFVILFVATVLTALGAAAYAMRRERLQGNLIGKHRINPRKNLSYPMSTPAPSHTQRL